MPRLHKFSIRARLTFIFVLAVAAILSVTGVSLVHLVRHSLAGDADNEIQSQMIRTQEIFANAKSPDTYRVVLAMHGDVVIQVTNLAGTKVWAASSAIAKAPSSLARDRRQPHQRPTGAQNGANVARRATLSQISSGQIGTIFTKRGSGLIFGFVYGQGIDSQRERA
jgi:hypothetical protein